MSEIVSKELISGINLHHIHDEKFNSIAIRAFIVRDLDQNTTKASLLSKVLQRGTNKYPNALELEKVFEDNYGTVFNINVIKIGENNLFVITLLMPDKKIIGEEKGSIAFMKNIDLLNELLFNPFTESGALSSDYVEREKKALEDEINSVYNSKGQWALKRCIEISCENEPYSMPSQGRIEDLEEIDNISLTKFYKDMINTCPVEVYIAGDVGEEDISLLSEGLLENFSARSRFKPKKQQKHLVEKVNEVFEKDDLNQGKLVMCLRTQVDPCSDELAAYILYNAILGGGVYSKLFKIIREKNSLAYYVHSAGDRNKMISFIEAGVNASDYQQTVDLITQILTSMKTGEIILEEIKQARDSVINSLWSIEDFVGGNINQHIVGVLSGCPMTTEELESKLRNVTLDSIIQVANKVTLDTIYFLSSEFGDDLID